MRLNPMRLALFVSGGGTTMEYIMNACKDGGKLHGNITPVLVVASKSGIGAIEKARRTGLIEDRDIVVINPHRGDSKGLGSSLIEECKSRGVSIFGQYGWLVKTPNNFLEKFPRGINQHPAPLHPGHMDFGGQGMYGRRCHLSRLLFVRMTGRRGNDCFTSAVAQRVHPEYDMGAVIAERRMSISPSDDVDTIQRNLLPIEHEVQVEALNMFANARLEQVETEELVKPHERSIWSFCREAGKLAYPKG